MKNLKNTFVAITMMTVLAFGTTFANAGIIIAGLKDSGETKDKGKRPVTTCTEPAKSDLTGIIIAGYTGIIIAGLTGIIIAGVADDGGVTNCGIIIAG